MTRTLYSTAIVIQFLVILAAQPLYTNALEPLRWLRTSGLAELDFSFFPVSELTLNESGGKTRWMKYLALRVRENPAQTNNHYLSTAAKYSRRAPDALGYYHDSDLLGNGLITYYRFSRPGLEIVNSMFFTYNKDEATRGFVRTVSNVTMYTNLAYVKLSFPFKIIQSHLTLGRDHLLIGYGIGGNLFLSGYSRPFDQLRFSTRYRNIRLLFSVVQVDPLEGHKRYLYLHSLAFKFWDKLYLTLGESILRTGENLGLEPRYFNPFHLWSWEHEGTRDIEGNGFIYGGLSWYPWKGTNLWAEILFDDINVSHPNAFYLNRYAYLLGLQITGFPLSSSNLWLEYSNVANQVYQSYRPQHTYIHRGFPMGHYLGNDFDQVRFHYAQLTPSARFKPYIDLTYIRDGANGLDTPFEAPWEDAEGNVIPGYTPPPFPTPPVSFVTEGELGLEYSISYQTFVTAGFFYQRVASQGEVKEDFSILFRLWVNLGWSFNY